MKKNRRIIAVVVLILCLGGGTSVHAGDFRPYVGIGTGSFYNKYSESQSLGGFSVSGSRIGGFLKAGFDHVLFDHLDELFAGLELRVGTAGSVSKTFSPGTIGSPVPFNVSIHMGTFFSYFGKLEYNILPSLSVYGLLGGTAGRFSNESSLGVRGSVHTWKTGLSYGVGAQYGVSKQLKVGAEWVQYWKNVPLSIVQGASSKASVTGISLFVNKFF